MHIERAKNANYKERRCTNRRDVIVMLKIRTFYFAGMEKIYIYIYE